jgi:hypothetical protein
MNRRKKKKLTQFENDLKAKFIPSIKTQERGFYSSRIIYNLNFKKRLRKKRERGKEDF